MLKNFPIMLIRYAKKKVTIMLKKISPVVLIFYLK